MAGSEPIQEIINVAHSLSAKKRVRQNLRQRARNRARKESIKVELKAFTVAAATGDPAKAEAELRKVASRLDKVAAKGTIHKNTAARKRSRLAKRVNALRNKPAGTATAKA
jgi:small subunit ribosomal protein S20